MVDPLKRLKRVERLIDQKLYFTLHAPRQTGKTTYLYALAKKLNTEGKYIALVVSLEQAGFKSITPEEANLLLNASIYQEALENLPEEYRPENPQKIKFLNVNQYLKSWCANQQKPIILFLDEIDSLMDDVLVSILRQLRSGYPSRPKHFPSSLALVGLRDVREYKIKVRDECESAGKGSPFNIKSDSLLMSNFEKEEVFELLEQHTQDTGQGFPDDVKEEIFRLSNGQPWLVNALAKQIVEMALDHDYSKPITIDILTQAKNELIQRRDTHLDSLIEKLKEERVKKIVQAIINGDNLTFDTLNDDILYVRDLGIVSQTDPLKFANPVYAEIIPRVMAYSIQVSLPVEIETRFFFNENNEIDMKKVLEAFQEFYRENAEFWLDRYEFKESANHLLLMAFLQRIVNSGGEITREMALGNGRIDILVNYHHQRVALELKIKRGSQSIEKAKKQLSDYLDKLGLKEGYLVIFDPADIEWEKKIYMNEISYNDKTIIMVGV
ncbi:MAG: ATP-binding protein [Candidatus Omnitrophota bacterium]